LDKKMIVIYTKGYDWYKAHEEEIQAAIDAGKSIWDVLKDSK